jgi:hypothetical protein
MPGIVSSSSEIAAANNASAMAILALKADITNPVLSPHPACIYAMAPALRTA